LKVIIPQQNGPLQPLDITKDVTCIGEDDGGRDEDGCGDGEDVDGEDDGGRDEDGCGDGEDVILLGDFLVKSR
jgi:hypothetical protein